MSSLYAAILSAIAFLVSPAVQAAPLTPEQQARCDAPAMESYRKACRDGYSTAALKFPAQAEEGTSWRSGGMAIVKPAGRGPFPTLVVMHTCDNIDADQLRYWVRAAIERGHVAFVLDSFTQRSVQRGTCTQTPADFTFPVYPTRARDAYDALRHLAGLPYVDRSRISAIGFSQGGRIGYMMAGQRIATMFSDPGLGFRRIVSVYGRCRSPVSDKRWWVQDDSATPLLALLGGKDSDGDASECLPRFEMLKASGRPVEWHVYANAAHAWDNRRFVPPRQVSQWGIPGNMVRFEYDPRVTDDSRDRAFSFIAR